MHSSSHPGTGDSMCKDNYDTVCKNLSDLSKTVEGLQLLLAQLSSPEPESPAVKTHADTAPSPCTQPGTNMENIEQPPHEQSSTISLDDFMFGEEATEMDLN